MRNIDYKLNDDFELIFPNVGDAELRTISFNSPDTHIGLWLPMRNVELLITMHKSSLLSVWSAVPQNVIDRLFVFPNLVNAKLPKNSATKDALEKALENQDEMILTIEPIVGSRLICSAQRVHFRPRPIYRPTNVVPSAKAQLSNGPDTSDVGSWHF